MRKIIRWIDYKLSEMKISTFLFIVSIFLIASAVLMALYVAENLVFADTAGAGIFVFVMAVLSVSMGVLGLHAHDAMVLFEKEFDGLIKKGMQNGKS